MATGCTARHPEEIEPIVLHQEAIQQTVSQPGLETQVPIRHLSVPITAVLTLPHLIQVVAEVIQPLHDQEEAGVHLHQAAAAAAAVAEDAGKNYI